jgi:large subunit ribosomal protein L6
MSRVANSPVVLPSGVEFKLEGEQIAVKGGKGSLTMPASSNVDVKLEDGKITFAAKDSSKAARAMSGTMRSLINNMVVGVSEGFEKKLVLNGVGYRAKASGKVLNLTLGFSHPVDYQLPEGVSAETPSQTEIVVKGIDKQQVGQVASEIRAFRPPEPYKGKGVRYADEYVRRKEAKKK